LPASLATSWALVPAVHGRGYATEAVGAALAWGERRFGANARTVCIISPENLASIRVATKCGFRIERPTRYGDEEVMLYARGAA